MTSINPLLQTKITQQQNAAQTPNKTSQIDLAQKPDRVEINSATNKKKVAKYAGIGIAIACTIATTAFLLTKGKTCLLEFNAKKAQKYAEDIKEKAEKLKNEVIELFNAGGNEVAKITDDVDYKIMEEFDSSGTLIRKSTFNLDGTLSEIKLPTKKGADLYNFKDGELTEYTKNFQEDSEGNTSIAKILHFWDGELTAYTKNFQQDSEGIQSTAKKLLFEDGKLTGYTKNFQQDSEENQSIAKILVFEDGKLAEYKKNIRIEENVSIEKEIEFTPGKPLINLLEFLKSFKKKT